MARRNKSRHQFKKRSAPKFNVNKRVLIVCEGKKTEPSYFNELVKYHGLNPSAIKIKGMGKDPLSVVQHAKRLGEEALSTGDGYDEIYCVFDKNGHSTFGSASDKAIAKRFKLARSWPCFEFWLLLHFKYTRKSYVRSGNCSPADNCINDLKAYIKSYEKTATGLYGKLKGRLKTANERSVKAMNDALVTEQFNPSTEIHKLVNYLQSLESRDSQ